MRRRKRMLKDLDDDIRDYLERETQDNMDRGMPAEEARFAALRKLGNVRRVKEETWKVWSIEWLECLLQDFRFAFRSLRKAPGHTASVVLTLALGLGSVATMLAIVDSVLLRPAAIPRPHELVMLYLNSGQNGMRGGLTWSQIQDLQRNSRLFTSIAGYTTMIKPVGTSNGTGWAIAVQVTPGFFRMLNVQPTLGRLPEPNSTGPAAVVSHDFWQERLGSDPHAVGSVIHLDGEARTIIGVLPRGMSILSGTGGPVVYTTISQPSQRNVALASVFAMARIQPGVSVSQALAEARSILAHSNPQDEFASRHFSLQSYDSYLTGSLQKPLFVLLGGVMILLLISLANAANLQIARTMERMTEMYVRSALGASFSRLFQQLLVESVVISLLGAALGCALAYGSAAAIRTEYGNQYARFREIAVHPNVIVGISFLAFVAGMIASLAPAFSIRHQARTAAITQHATPRMRMSGILVALQIALTCVLLATTGLFVRTFDALRQIPLGFNAHHLTNLVIMPVDSRQPPLRIRQMDNLLLERFGTLPGVESAAMQSSVPFSVYTPTLACATDVSGRPFQNGDMPLYNFVSSNFVTASGIQMLKGRAFTTQDDTSPDIVALVNQAFVSKFLLGRNPIGVILRSHRLPRPPRNTGPGILPEEILSILEPEPNVPLKPSFTIIGVVQNELQGQDLGAPIQPMIYLNYRQIPDESSLLGIIAEQSQFVIRSRLPQGVLNKELRTTLKQVAPEMSEMQLYPMEEELAHALGERSLGLRLVSSFGAIALLLAAIGIYAMLAYAVTIRRREIGVRMALGSSRSRVTKLVLRQAGRMVLAGVIPGLVGAWAAGRAVQAFLFGVKPLDPRSLVTAIAILLLTGMVAAVLPAWRAALVDPMEVLRVE